MPGGMKGVVVYMNFKPDRYKLLSFLVQQITAVRESTGRAVLMMIFCPCGRGSNTYMHKPVALRSIVIPLRATSSSA
jgi:hypothetical protein